MTADPLASTELDDVATARPTELPADEAMAAVRLGLWISAARCVLTYVVAPMLGALGVFLGPVGLLLQVLGAVTSVSGARRLFALRHRFRYVYGFVATAIVLSTVVSFAQLLH